ncbi:hypothetical protein [Dictyobacter aurantiacus]|uniref:ATP-grasp domain-containing protein n=1 Tax=Dictyobacter aurantiacus TaxID=1936993 RepID=A0A401ZNL0_9CHLR|nr:hypothetical protein [Dictyobacter aurantiacus]GCE08394.1 hypothetical protein KDAU_57230 [Dictyobacter aurantiacus]
MTTLDTSLFCLEPPATIGVGFHNIGSGILRASHSNLIRKLEAQYGERCGHLPLNAEKVRIHVTEHTADLHAHIAYLGALFGKDIKATTSAELRQEQQGLPQKATLVVPYINVPESEHTIQTEMGGISWGLPGAMVSQLKNKANFYQLLDEYALPDFQPPDYRIANIHTLPGEALRFLTDIEDIYDQASLHSYPPGIMLRTSESDGNFGSSLLYSDQNTVHLIPNGDADLMQNYRGWREALEAAQAILLDTMDPEKETRVVMSRCIDFSDSPGMSVVIMNGQIETLRWNGQLQEKGSKACIGTGNYQPKNKAIARLQKRYEDQTIAYFEQILRRTAERCGYDFTTLRGVANIDIMIPSPLEAELQKRRGQPSAFYVAESNPRWTNFTDAILNVIGANRLQPTVNTMRATISNRIQAVDKYYIPQQIDPRQLRARIADKDEELKASGTRIICRMAKHPMGIIFAGDIERAKHELAGIVQHMAEA